MGQRPIEPFYVTLTSGFMTRTGFQFTVRGADGDEDESEEDADDEDAGSEGQDGEDSGEKDNRPKTVSVDEFERLQKRMKAADQNAATLAKKVKEYEDANKDETTKATERVQELESSIEEKDGTIGALRLQVGFLSSNDFAWDDAEYALDYAERKGYLSDVRDEDGNVDPKELKAALAKLAKDKPSMLAKSKDDDEDEERPPTGGNVGGKRKKSKSEFDEAELRRKFPAAYV